MAGVLHPHHRGSRKEVDPGAQGRFIKEVIPGAPQQQGRNGVQRVFQLPSHFCTAPGDWFAARSRNLQREGEHPYPILRGVKGLTKEQLEASKAKGVIIDEDSAISSSLSTVSTPPPSQSNDGQAQSTPSAQESIPTPDAGDSSAPSSKPGP